MTLCHLKLRFYGTLCYIGQDIEVNVFDVLYSQLCYRLKRKFLRFYIFYCALIYLIRIEKWYFSKQLGFVSNSDMVSYRISYPMLIFKKIQILQKNLKKTFLSYEINNSLRIESLVSFAFHNRLFFDWFYIGYTTQLLEACVWKRNV